MDGDGLDLRGFVRDEAVLIASAILAVASMVLVPPSSDYLGYIDVRVLCILFCFMAVIAGMQHCNLFDVLAERVLRGNRGLWVVCLLLVVLPLVCSMFITNDVALIAFVPFSIVILTMAGERRLMIPVIVLQTVAANLGSMLLPFGNPQNLFISSRYDVGLADFISLMLPVFAVGAAVLVLMCTRFGKGTVHVEFDRDKHLSDRWFLIPMCVLFVLCILTVLRVIPYQAVLVVTLASVVLMRPGVLRKVDYSLLLTFVCLFVFAGNIASMESVRTALEGLMSWDPMLSSLTISQVISNVPASVMLSGFTDNWEGLLMGVDIGGFGTPIASMASIISLRIYMRSEDADLKGYLIRFTAVNVLMLAVLVPVYVVIMG